MCLRTRKQKPLVAENDITVYKVLSIKSVEKDTPSEDDFLYTPVTNTKVKIGDFINAKLKTTYLFRVFGVYEVGAEGVHSFINLRDARAMSISHGSFTYKVFECTIPKGTEYWVGITTTEIASKKLLVKRVVHTYE